MAQGIRYPHVKKIIMGDRAFRLMFTYAMSQRLLQRALTTSSHCANQ